MQDIFVGRQPIYDAKLDVIGYELLFRSGEANRAGQIDDVRATSQVIINSVVGIGLPKLVGDRLAFINLSRAFLDQAATLPLPASKIVFEVLETVVPDGDIDLTLSGLRERGFGLALDDYVHDERWQPLLPLVDFIKLDVLALPKDVLLNEVARLRSKGVALLAEKVEDQAMFEQCRDLGFHYFQGYFLSRPEVVRGQRLQPNQLALLQLLAKLQDPLVEVGDLEGLIAQDVALSYELLKLVNSAQFALPKQVDSVRQAVLMLGVNAVRRYVSLLMLAGDRSRPPDLLTTALRRAHMAELLSAKLGRADPEVYFTIGLFSMLDIFMKAPLSDVLAPLALGDEVKAALLRQEGPYADVLSSVLAHEYGQFDDCRLPGLSADHFTSAYLDAGQWAEERVAELWYKDDGAGNG
jgi:c-di-GMP phosphodiesterase